MTFLATPCDCRPACSNFIVREDTEPVTCGMSEEQAEAVAAVLNRLEILGPALSPVLLVADPYDMLAALTMRAQTAGGTREQFLDHCAAVFDSITCTPLPPTSDAIN